MVERLHRCLKNSLRAHQAAKTWPDVLPWVLLGLRANPREDDGLSAFEAVFGAVPVLPSSLLQDESAPAEVLEGLRRVQRGLPVRPLPEDPASTSSTSVPPGLKFVYVREDGVKTPLQELYRGPYRVLRQSRNTVLLQVGDRQDTVSLSRIKPCLLPSPEVAEPPRRGRPRGPPGGRC